LQAVAEEIDQRKGNRYAARMLEVVNLALPFFGLIFFR
jgi:hypothetical protein